MELDNYFIKKNRTELKLEPLRIVKPQIRDNPSIAYFIAFVLS